MNYHVPYGPYERYIKRVLGFIGAVIAIVILSPVLLGTALVIRVTMGSPVIFKQKRPGLNEKVFKMYKFRSMKNATDQNGKKLTDTERLQIIKEKGPEFVSSDEDRITKFGRFIRKYSIDELPELFNILKGDRGIIGTTKKSIEYSRVVTV